MLVFATWFYVIVLVYKRLLINIQDAYHSCVVWLGEARGKIVGGFFAVCNFVPRTYSRDVMSPN